MQPATVCKARAVEKAATEEASKGPEASKDPSASGIGVVVLRGEVDAIRIVHIWGGGGYKKSLASIVALKQGLCFCVIVG